MKETENDQTNQIDTNAWLRSVIKLTEYKDYVPLTLAFLEKLKSIPGLRQINIYEVYGAEDENSTDALILKDVLGLLNTPIPYYERIRLNDSELKDNKDPPVTDIQQTVFPIKSSGKVQRILVIDWCNVHQENWENITSALIVYSNLLNIIDEKDRDRLTGLLNRYTFDNNLENIIRHSKQQFEKARGGYDKSSWIALLDIDHFKQVNDNYGHIMGDEVLLLFARLLLSTFRYSDVVFRFGGEEFVVVLTGCDKQGVEIVLNRFRTIVENHLFPQVGRITVSAGYVLLDTTQPPNILLDQADQALYQAKETGRNRVVSYEDFSAVQRDVDDINDVELF